MTKFLAVIFLIGGLIFFPPQVSAHVKWFVPSTVPQVSAAYQLLHPYVLGFLIFAVLVLSIGIFLDRLLSLPKNLVKALTTFQPTMVSLFSVLLGLSFILFSLSGYVFAPTLITHNQFGSILLVLQLLIGLAFLGGIFVRTAAIALVILYILCLFILGIGDTTESFEILGIAALIYILGRPKWKITDFDFIKFSYKEYEDYAVPLLRVMTGISLIIVAFSEKIFAPDLGLVFLQTHYWNFTKFIHPHLLSDYWFVFFAGAVEALVGIALIFGIVTRIVALLAAGLFITTLILLGPIELFGHLPFFAIVFILLTFGAGKKLRISNSTYEN